MGLSSGFFMNVIILGTKRKLLPVYNYCRDKNYNISVMGDPKADHENDTDILTSIATSDIEIIPDIVINMKEQSSYLIKETRLNEKFGLNGNYSNTFFWSKQCQDETFKSLNIPTVPNESDTVIIKTDMSGGTGFKICNRKNAHGFYQDYLDIDYIVSCHLYSDGKTWYHLNNHKIWYEDNCPSKSITPCTLGEDYDMIDESINKLSKHLHIHNKLFGLQFLKSKDRNLYPIDFNLRPFGGYDMGSYDTDVSKENWCNYIFGNIPPEYIDYHSQVMCHYTEKRLFGYSPVKRLKTDIKKMRFKVKRYDSILLSI